MIGGVSSAAIEKPHRSGWRPLLECEFDLAYTPLMEMDYARGRVILCTLDLEDHLDQDPAARPQGPDHPPQCRGRVREVFEHFPRRDQVERLRLQLISRDVMPRRLCAGGYAGN